MISLWRSSFPRTTVFPIGRHESRRRNPRSGQIGRTLLPVQTRRGRERPGSAAFRIGQKQLEQGLKQEKVRLKIDALLEENGIKP